MTLQQAQTTPQATQGWLQKIRWLTQALIISGTLNIGLFATFIYFVVKDRQDSISFDHRPAPHGGAEALSCNEELLRSYCTLSFQDLLLRLENKDLAEEGFTKRDLALATLVAYHHFNLERALGGLVVQKRELAFKAKEGEELIGLTVFPGLADYQYEAIIHYAKTERWPFTSQGLFYEVKRSLSPRNPTLLEAFYLSPEFHAAFTLFTRTEVPINKEILCQLLSEGEWKILNEFSEQQKQAQDLSPQRRRLLLLSYLNYKSKTAAALLLDTDKEFIVKRFDDQQLILFLDMFTEKTPAIELLCKETLASPRSDSVRKKAASVLYTFAGETPPEPLDNGSALSRFSSGRPAPSVKAEIRKPEKSSPVVITARPVTKQASTAARPQQHPPRARPKHIHTIEYGDTLSKIARRYHVTVDALKKQNNLQNDKLREGRSLEIP